MPFFLDDLGTRRLWSPQVLQCTGNKTPAPPVVAMTTPVITGPTVVWVGSTVTLTATATSLLAGGSITAYVWVKPDGSTEIKTPVNGNSTITYLATGAAGDAFTSTVYARDNTGNQSSVTVHTAMLTVPVPPDVSNLTTNIPVTITGGEIVNGLTISGATDPNGGTVTYALSLPAGLTASKITGLTNNEVFTMTASNSVAANPNAIISITVTTTSGTTSVVNRNIAIAVAPPVAVNVDTVFAPRIYSGSVNGQPIANELDQRTVGGLIWTKNRTLADLHQLSLDVADPLQTNQWKSTYLTTGTDVTNSNRYLSQYTGYLPIGSITETGYTVSASDTSTRFNAVNSHYVSWAFCKAPRFHDVVTITTTTAPDLEVSHNLRCRVGAVLFFRNDGTTGPLMWHWLEPDKYSSFSSTTSFTTGALIRASTNNTITVGVKSTGILETNTTYTAYLFAHDPATDGVIYCGRGMGGVGESMSGKWEPQWTMQTLKDGDDFRVVDISRGWSSGTNSACLKANAASTETRGNYGYPTATGFVGAFPEQSSTVETLYIAIRKGVNTPLPPEPTVRFKVLGTSYSTGTWTVPAEANGLLTFTGNGGAGTPATSGTREVQETYEVTAGYYNTVETGTGHFEQQLVAAGYYRQEVLVQGHFEQGAMLTPGRWEQDYTNGGWHYENQQVCEFVKVLTVAEYWEQVPGYWVTNGDGSQTWLQPNQIFHEAQYQDEWRCEYRDVVVNNPPIWVEPTYEQVWVETIYKQTWVDPVYTQVWVPPGTSQVWVPPVYGTRTVTVPYTIPETAGGDTVAYWGSGVNSYEQAASNKRIKFAGNPGSVSGAPAQSTVTATAPAAGTVISFVINGYLKVEW